eukprot:CAMPEP_0174736800 /NCGR_PEP_ID=MMETSP1094-20130205/67285_1 /TAXON_ID=156173 /ORGANISM="Chrysochromulina brevifilum, Strain UTEX LB 985" /LENGTH=73 /DNA_ID=CAMNT_0015939957 /DNA_START=1 /DNA_END=222 /DNA_ORIENTATION=+
MRAERHTPSWAETSQRPPTSIVKAREGGDDGEVVEEGEVAREGNIEHEARLQKASTPAQPAQRWAQPRHQYRP